MSAPLASAAELPSDGCITIKGWEHGSRRKGWHLEERPAPRDLDSDFVVLMASPMNITTGEVTGEPRRVRLSFALDTIEAMP